MKFLTFTFLTVVALTKSEEVRDRRGDVGANQAYALPAPASLSYTKLQQQPAALGLSHAYSAAAPAAIAYTKVQQPTVGVQKTVVATAPQPQYYTQPQTYSIPVQQQQQYQQYQQSQPQQQYQYEPQAVAYAQPSIAKYAPAPAAKVTVARPQFSLANDVSSFTYSSPVVTYNNLGLLSQVVGKLAQQQQQQQTTAKVSAPAPAVYQAPLQKVAYAQPAAATYSSLGSLQTKLAAAPQVQTKYVSAPQQYVSAVPQQTYVSAAAAQAYTPQAQQAYTVPQTYSASGSQAYSAPQTYSSPQTYSAPQNYAAQTVPQAVYSQAPQYYSPSQLKQINSGVAYAQ